MIESTLRASIACSPGVPSKRCCGPSPTPNALTVDFMKTFSGVFRVPAGTPSTFHGILTSVSFAIVGRMSTVITLASLVSPTVWRGAFTNRGAQSTCG